MNNLVGKILLNRYQIEAFIDSGRMGSVFRARDFKRNTRLAVKVLNEDLADDPSIFKQFRREARALERLSHPHIVPFYGLYRDEEVNFLLEGYIDGPTLKKLLQQRKGQPLPLSEALSFLKVLCSALGYAQTNGVVHCDVKPGNVILDQGGNIYLAVFGIVRHAGSTTTTLISASPSPFYSTTPTSSSLFLQENSFCRGGPGTGYDKIWTFNSGDVLDIIGKDGDWWLVQFDDPRTRHKQCWVNSSIGAARGDVNSVPLSDYRTSK